MLGHKKAGTVSGAMTLVSCDTTVVGDLHFSGNLDIEGLVQGNIVAKPGKDALVRIVGEGCIEGEIRAPLVVINGKVKGDVHCTERLELAEHARVEGNVFYVLLEMAVGAEVNGNLTHVDPPARPARSRKSASKSGPGEADAPAGASG
jgi:cytoskeletal protein CcmA (bactofilin family)